MTKETYIKHEMKLPAEPARAIELCKKAGLTDRETKIVIQKNYPVQRVIEIVQNKPRTLREIGDEFHLTPEGVRYIHNNAIKKLKAYVHSES